MANKVKWLLITAAVLIVALIVTLYTILSSYDYNDLKPHIAKAAWKATGRKLTIGGDIRLKFGLTPVLVLTDIKFQNALWGTRTNIAKIRQFEVQVALLPLLKRNIEVKRLILVKPDILIETDKYGKSNLVLEAPKKPIPPPEEETTSAEDISLLPAFTFKKIQIEKGYFVYRDGQSGKTYKVRLKLLTASTAGIDGHVKISLKGDYNNQPFNVTGTIGPPAALLNSDKAWSLSLIAKAFDATVTLDGSVKDIKTPRGMDLDFCIKTRDLTKLSQLTGKTLPLNEPLEMSFRATDIGFKTYRLSDFKATLGSNDLNGSIDINLVKKRPLLTAMLLSKTIDLRPNLPANKKTGNVEVKNSKPTEKSKKVFPDDPLLLDALNQAEGTVKIQADRFLLPGLALNHLTAEITLKGGHLTIRPIKAAIGSGKLNGSLTIASRGKAAAVSTQFEVENCELKEMLKGLNLAGVIDGNLNVDINLKGRGRSVATLMAALDGFTSINISQGRINNKYINLLGADISTSFFRILSPKKEKLDYTKFNCLVSRFDITKGHAVSTAMVFDTDSVSVIGQGEINLKTEKINFVLHPVPKKGIGVKSLGKLSLSLGKLAEPFKLGGTLAQPSLAFDPTGTAITLGKAIGGTLLFGPLGIAAALVNSSSGNENPCLTAIEVIKNEAAATNNANTAKEKSSIKKSTNSISESIKGIGNRLKNLFGQ